MLFVSDNNQAGVVEAFDSTFRYLDDLLNIDNPIFEHIAKLSEYDQEMPQSHTADQPTASRGRAAEYQQSHDTRKTFK